MMKPYLTYSDSCLSLLQEKWQIITAVRLSGALDIINSIAVFQLIFFITYLFVKGNKIPSTLILKIHLLFQLAGYIGYIYWSREYNFVKPFLLLSMPSWFIWAPTFYFYIRSRLYKDFTISRNLLLHALPAVVMMVFILQILITGYDFHDRLKNLGQIFFYISKIQIIVYNIYTLFIIYNYKTKIKFLTSASEENKLDWLLFITYGLAGNSFIDFVFYLIPEFTNIGLGYIIFLVFINFLFFKAILNPDQFLGLEERMLIPIKLSIDKGSVYFNKMEAVINEKRLYLDPDLNLRNVAQAVKLSERAVSQAIRQNVELNFSDYINKKRIDYAKEVLMTTTKSEKNVLEILYEAGFNSKSVFNAQFKKHTGLSPTEFRSLNK